MIISSRIQPECAPYRGLRWHQFVKRANERGAWFAVVPPWRQKRCTSRLYNSFQDVTGQSCSRLLQTLSKTSPAPAPCTVRSVTTSRSHVDSRSAAAQLRTSAGFLSPPCAPNDADFSARTLWTKSPRARRMFHSADKQTWSFLG